MPVSPRPRPPDGNEPRRHSLGLLPFADESLESFVFRLARRRRTEAPSSLALRTCMPRPWTRVTLAGLERLAADADVPLESLMPLWRGNPNDTFVLFGNSRLPASALDQPHPSARRVCGECLAERGYHRGSWDLSFVSACPVHRKVLVDTCPDCGNPLHWRGYNLTRCGCREGGDLTKVRAPPVTPEQAHATACVMGLLRDWHFATEAVGVLLLRPFQGMAPGHVVEFLFRLGLEMSAARPRQRLFAFERLGDDEVPSHEVLARALAAVRVWPTGLHAALDDMRRRYMAGTERTTQRVTEPIVRWARPLPQGSGRAIVEAIEQYRRATRGLPHYAPHRKRGR